MSVFIKWQPVSTSFRHKMSFLLHDVKCLLFSINFLLVQRHTHTYKLTQYVCLLVCFLIFCILKSHSRIATTTTITIKKQQHQMGISFKTTIIKLLLLVVFTIIVAFNVCLCVQNLLLFKISFTSTIIFAAYYIDA